MFFEELLYLMNIDGIGKTAINRGYFPWRSSRDTKAPGKSRILNTVGMDSCEGPSSGISSGEVPDSCEFSAEGFTTYRFLSREAMLIAEEWLNRSGRMLTDREREMARDQTCRELEWLSEHDDVRACTIFDREYPAKLLDMGARRPPLLFVRSSDFTGKDSGIQEARWKQTCQLLQKPSLAVIGSRWPGPYALQAGPDFAEMVAERSGMTIVSGLARGCDRMGHIAAIKAGTATAAVIPCGPDQVVPEFHRDLARHILDKKGWLVTEYPPGTPPEDYRYVERDRITAALSSAVVVIECEEKSGTMHTVRAAAGMGRPVGCWMPENAEQHGFAGNLYMMRHMGASSIDDERTLDKFLDRITCPESKKKERGEQLSLF